MIYITEIIGQLVNRKTMVTGYRALDTLSESIILLTPIQLRSIFSSSNIQVANADLRNKEIKVTDWVTEIATGRLEDGNRKCPLILLAKKEHTYKITNYKGEMSEVSFEILRKHINENRVANCRHVDKEDELKTRRTNAYKIITDETFNKEIDSKYETFIAKTKLLGYKSMSFDYEIENKQVKLGVVSK